MGLTNRSLTINGDVSPESAELVALRPLGYAWSDDEAAWRKVRSLALHRLDQMMSLEPKVLRGNKPAAIHDFRVASRRFQQIFDLLCPPEPPRGILRLRRSIGRSRKALSGVRNHDIFIQRIDKILARKRPARQETWEAVREYLGKRRAEAHARAVEEIGKLNLSRVYVRLRVALEPGGFFAGCNGEEAANNRSSGFVNGHFQPRLFQQLTQIWDALQKAKDQASTSSDASAVHSLRLAVKRLRYLMEIVHEFEKPLSGRVIALARSLQDYLGDWHDFEAADQILAEMAARPKFMRRQLGLAVEILKLMQLNRKAKERLLARHPSLLDATTGEQLKRCVSTLLGASG